MTTQPAILVVTGASGAGKTTLVRALDAMRIPGVGCFELDSMEVPSAEEMMERWGGTMEWQNVATRYWIERLLRNDGGHEVAVLDGQVRPSEVRAAFTSLGARVGGVTLVDCEADERNARLRGPRGQPDLVSGQMDGWAAYLRGQCDALDLPRIDTSGRTTADCVAELAAQVEALRRLRAAE